VNRGACVYRAFSADGVLVYIGCTGNDLLRFEQHRASKDWWPSIANITVEHFPSRLEAMAAEAKAIREEGPLVNADASEAGRKAWVNRLRFHGRATHCPYPGCPLCVQQAALLGPEGSA